MRFMYSHHRTHLAGKHTDVFIALNIEQHFQSRFATFSCGEARAVVVLIVVESVAETYISGWVG